MEEQNAIFIIIMKSLETTLMFYFGTYEHFGTTTPMGLHLPGSKHPSTTESSLWMPNKMRGPRKKRSCWLASFKVTRSFRPTKTPKPRAPISLWKRAFRNARQVTKRRIETPLARGIRREKRRETVKRWYSRHAPEKKERWGRLDRKYKKKKKYEEFNNHQKAEFNRKQRGLRQARIAKLSEEELLVRRRKRRRRSGLKHTGSESAMQGATRT